jgi:hypothetical protein
MIKYPLKNQLKTKAGYSVEFDNRISLEMPEGSSMRILALSLILLALGLASAQDNSPQWTGEPWIKSNASASSSPSPSLSLPAFSDINLSSKEPQSVVLGKEMIPFQEYSVHSRSAELWLRSGANWNKYLEAKKGDSLEILAYAPFGGSADLYCINYASSSILHRSYNFRTGYHNATFKADQIGRILLVLTVENQPSNALVIDVLPPTEPAKGPKDVEQFSPGFAWVAIASNWLKGYDVYLDSVFYSSDIADGSLDGNASFKVGGDSIHTITVLRKGSLGVSAYRSEHTKSFQSGYSYKLKI